MAAAVRDDASYGLAHEEQRQRRNLGDTIRKTAAAMQVERADVLLDLIDADLQHVIERREAASSSARHFEKLCNDFAGGVGYYLAYRVLSSFAHTTLNVCEAYVESHDPLVFQLEPRTAGGAATWLFHTCCALTWSARAADCLDRDHPNRSFLRAAAKELGIQLDLQLSDATLLRREKERHERKQQSGISTAASACTRKQPTDPR